MKWKQQSWLSGGEVLSPLPVEGRGRSYAAFESRTRCVFSICLFLIGICLWTVRAQDAVTTLNPGNGEPGYVNGPLGQAKFNDPAGLVYDVQGNLFVADSRNHVIRKVATDGTVSLVAGDPGQAGYANGTGSAAKFDTPFGLTIANDGALLVADTGNHIIRRVAANGAVTIYAGLAGTPGNTNGTLSVSRFHSPLGIKRDTAGNIWVADSGTHTIRKISTAGMVTTEAGTPDSWGWEDGPAANAKFNGPVDVAVATDGRVFVSDGFNHVIRCLQTNGVVTTVAGQGGKAGWTDGLGAEARFWNPAGLAFDAAANLYIADSRNHVLRKLDASGRVTTVSGIGQVEGHTDGVNRAGLYFNPYGLAFDATGNLTVSDSYNQLLRQVFVPFTIAVTGNPSERLIQWSAVTGKQYQVQYKEALESGVWLNLSTPITADSQEMSLLDKSAGVQRFYRVILALP